MGGLDSRLDERLSGSWCVRHFGGLPAAQAEPGLKALGLPSRWLMSGEGAYAFAYSFKVFILFDEYL
jgi:hypothetical protein